ncbi:MAG: class I SAM-dependent methyltransferase [Candidatus Aminicenantes bacterium]|nr:class I SAM-dependent methyltransferase [Candidatus Aminicenantes bacterium]
MMPLPNGFPVEIDKKVKESLDQYMQHLLEYNRKVNLVSRKITPEALWQLIDETLMLEKYILKDSIVDAGSGNGILGIPIALLNPGKEVNLVESRMKKAFFLEETRRVMGLENVRAHCCRIEDFMKRKSNRDISMIARGFPGIGLFVDFLEKGLVGEVILITSENKIKKFEKDMVNVRKKTYNIQMRKNLKILKMENVSRET